tara:strand:+ start:90 stop:776 length:687 start_codon:yes stop_codon:yes gene_type:complete
MRFFFNIFNIIIIFILCIPANAHVQHYESLNHINFEIYRNDKYIGNHTCIFERSGDLLKVTNKIDFKIKKLGLELYKYKSLGTEIYKNGELIEFSSKTNQNGKEKYVNIELNNDNELTIDGSSNKGKVSKDFLIGTWWNHSLINSKAQISAVSGRVIHQKVSFLGKENMKIGNKTYKTLHFNFSSNDKKLGKDKKLNTDIWYEEDTLIWVKASFDRKGFWEYRLVSKD